MNLNYSWIDIMFAAILLICALSGLIRGFVKSFLSFFLVIGGIIAAKIFTPDAVFFLKTKTRIYSNIASYITEKIAQAFSGTITGSDVTQSANVVNIPQSLMQFLGKFVDSTNSAVGTTAEAFGQNAADIIVKVIAFVGIFLGVLLVGSLLLFLLEKLADLPVIKTFNHLGGLAFGLVEGALILMILSTLLYSLNVFMQIDGLSQAINSSILIKYFYINFIFK